ncbi:5-carboxymethyl-2-hydroxymuconate Delta-isomerase [Saccharothrix sp. ST-888]|uniref:5-carboxymethyl-2-hydroxymuconate Delta-isomerase n=1 Tax=Saccharothrix sp. ST-888 TaxID=1427391 RepID=UPI0005EC2215|nr:hypothetical protein [Saccharothrix sp. ST-888]KJK57360.1 hypothetical protein UK12_17125 [Saccharothrix sp. ST-888]
MPQISIDYSAGVGFDRPEFVRNLHSQVAMLISTSVDNCKTVFRRVEELYVGHGGPQAATVYLEIRIIEGRDRATKAKLAAEILNLLARSVEVEPGVRAQVAVNVADHDREFYRKTSL